MATCSNGAQVLEGTVESVNERGVKIGGQWLNYSKWAGEIAEPRRGQVVALTLDGSGFVRAVGPADGAATGTHRAPVAARETAIIRQMCLKASAEFCAAEPEFKSADLFALAERMEAWVLR